MRSISFCPLPANLIKGVGWIVGIGLEKFFGNVPQDRLKCLGSGFCEDNRAKEWKFSMMRWSMQGAGGRGSKAIQEGNEAEKGAGYWQLMKGVSGRWSAGRQM